MGAVKKIRKRAYKKRRARIARVPKRSPTGLGFPRKMLFKHKYADLITLTDAAATTYYNFKCNGMYDPNTTGTGHQPMYFDQMGAIYNHYHVIGSKIRYRVVPAGTTVQQPYRIVTSILDDTSLSSGTLGNSELKGAKTRICSGGVNPSQIILTQKWSAKKFFGGSILANSDLKGTPTSDPSEQSSFHLLFATLDGVSTVTIWVFVEIEYIVLWSELKEVASS